MRLILLAALITLTTASTIHTFIPVTRKVVILQAPEATATPRPTTQYGQQDSKTYYTYATLDGATKELYSYDQEAPAPVKDTPEVQSAKQAHFEAYREAERRAALAKDEDQQEENGRQEDLREGLILDMIKQHNQDALVDTTYTLALSRKEESPNHDNAADRDIERDTKNPAELNSYGINRRLEEEDSRDLLEPLQLHTIYNIEDADSRRILKLGNLDSSLLQAKQLDEDANIETVRVPVNAYYTVLAPSGKYSVVTPTVYNTVSRLESLKRGHSLPISLSSTFLSHRINSKPAKT